MVGGAGGYGFSIESRASFPSRPASVPAARRFVAATLAGWDLAGCEEPARLAVSELVTNAVVHGEGEVGVTVRRGRRALRIEVEDRSPARPTRRDPPPAATSGRGLKVVEALAHAWGVETTAAGKRVWFELLVDGDRVGRRG